MEEKYNVSKKGADDKWHTFGSIKKNEWGNYGLSFKVDEALKNVVNIAENGTWINFALFEDKYSKAQRHHSESQKQQSEAKGNAYVKEDLDDEMPF